uniref:FXYD domain-containing ion transport regulator n=1 Tax=Electrophorus electricus TaxID=8005 RepID=A0AAY5EY75_ELEEL
MVQILALAFITLMSIALAEDTQNAEEQQFTFDYQQLRVGGLILAAVLCLIGVTILLSGHCRCKITRK